MDRRELDIVSNCNVNICSCTISGTLADESREAVGKLLRRSNKRSTVGTKKNKNNPQHWDKSSMVCAITWSFVYLCFLLMFVGLMFIHLLIG